ncbi:MAG: ornithine cyclodeaminase family protein [Acidobacteriota bacterium]|nr:ornithine cyclodeaminase family protein [Acidobacteriota bacterium]
MKPPETLVLTRSDVSGLLDLDDCIGAVESAFRAHGEGRAPAPGMLGFPAPGGGFHVKAAGLTPALGRPYFAVKTNSNFSANREGHGLPAIQGAIALFDGTDGRLLALMDSIEITILRTGAATAVAARYLARRDSSTAAICGCGNQGRVQLESLCRVLPIRNAHAFDADAGRAETFAAEMSRKLSIEVFAEPDLSRALAGADVCVTCTPSRSPFLRREHVAAGTFVAAVGSDSEDKQEIAPDLVASSTLVADVVEQCASIGELHHALEAGLMSRDDTPRTLGEVVAGKRPGRRDDAEITIFDSTGTALQDVAAASMAYERAVAEGAGFPVRLGA